MRDDLHRTLALTRPWQTVLRHAGREADHDKLESDIRRALDEHFRAEVSESWRNDFVVALAGACTDLFTDDKCAEVMDAAERRCRTLLERKLCETARGLFARDGARAGLVADAEAEVRRQCAESNIEQICAKVRPFERPSEVSALQDRLVAAAREADKPCPPKTKRKRQSKEAIADLLARRIVLDVE